MGFFYLGYCVSVQNFNQDNFKCMTRFKKKHESYQHNAPVLHISLSLSFVGVVVCKRMSFIPYSKTNFLNSL